MSEVGIVSMRRIEELLPPKQELSTIRPDDALAVATSIMVERDYSQLPVMSNVYKVEGIITWKSIGESASREASCKLVRECMDSSVRVACFDDPLLEPTENIAEHGYVLVRGDDGTVTGIVTASDLADQFRQLAEPFLVIEEIELHLRGIFKAKKLRVKHDLNTYYRELKRPTNWKRLRLPFDRDRFIDRLKSVNNTRNDVMHFKVDGLGRERLDELYSFTSCLREYIGEE